MPPRATAVTAATLNPNAATIDVIHARGTGMTGARGVHYWRISWQAQGRSSVGRAAVSKTVGRGFESLRPCCARQSQKRPDARLSCSHPSRSVSAYVRWNPPENWRDWRATGAHGVSRVGLWLAGGRLSASEEGRTMATEVQGRNGTVIFDGQFVTIQRTGFMARAISAKERSGSRSRASPRCSSLWYLTLRKRRESHASDE
jgi:hypothetical protein